MTLQPKAQKRSVRGVDELWQLVDPRVADDLSPAGDSRIALSGIDTGASMLCADSHAAEFQDLKDLSVFANAILFKKHRAERIELDRRRAQSHGNCADCQKRSRNDAIQRTLDAVFLHKGASFGDSEPNKPKSISFIIYRSTHQ